MPVHSDLLLGSVLTITTHRSTCINTTEGSALQCSSLLLQSSYLLSIYRLSSILFRLLPNLNQKADHHLDLIWLMLCSIQLSSRFGDYSCGTCSNPLKLSAVDKVVLELTAQDYITVHGLFEGARIITVRTGIAVRTI